VTTSALLAPDWACAKLTPNARPIAN
jgi:hypothetical protein